MAVTLTFDADGCFHALIEKLIEIADSIMEQFYNDAISGLDIEGQADSERIAAVWDSTNQYVTTKCEFYANALMQSFGVGSGADISSESYWNKYKSRSDFNSLRTGRTILGRKKGKYTNIFGEEQESTGRNAGKIIEGLHIKGKNGDYVQVKPIIAKRSIQNAERWLITNHQRRVEDKIEEELRNFLATEARNFFVEVQI